MKTSASLRDLVVVLFKYKYRMLLVLLVTLATVAIGTTLCTPIYEASSTLMVKFGREYVYLEIGGSKTPYNYFDREGIINAEIEILLTRELQEKCISTIGIYALYPDLQEKASEKANITDLALEKFGRNLVALGNKNTGIINLSFRHPDPAMAVRTLNLLVDLFKEKHLKVYSDSQTADFLLEKMNSYKTLLDETEKKIETYKNQKDVFSIKEQQRLLLGQRSDLELSLKTNRSQITELREKIASLENQKRALTLSNPIYSETEIKRKSDVYKSIEDALVGSRSELSSQMAKSAVVSGQLKDLVEALRNLTEQEKEIQNLERELKINEENFLIYEKKVEEARIQNEMDRLKMTNIQVVQEAVASAKPIAPRKEINMAVGLVLGLFGGLGLSVLQEYFNQGLNSSEAVQRRIGLPVLSAIAFKEK